ncbi:hypothetical protein C4K18_3167 [Pseudomonas chlororaphis subsp. aurantiaca]|nr:hypothetical protein C4K18_3167 [Pseudomonas chlororaphis subsp. aurantiaca]
MAQPSPAVYLMQRGRRVCDGCAADRSLALLGSGYSYSYSAVCAKARSLRR